MTDWRTVPICYVEHQSRILDERGEPLAIIAGQAWREWLSSVLSRNRAPGSEVTDPAGTPLFRFDYRRGDFRTWLKVMNPDGTLIARIDRNGSSFTRFKDRFTVRDASGVEIGRIDNPVLCHEFVMYDCADSRLARGVQRGESAWEVRRENVAAEPWPQLAAAFFLCITALMHPPR